MNGLRSSDDAGVDSTPVGGSAASAGGGDWLEGSDADEASAAKASAKVVGPVLSATAELPSGAESMCVCFPKTSGTKNKRRSSSAAMCREQQSALASVPSVPALIPSRAVTASGAPYSARSNLTYSIRVIPSLLT